MTKRYTVMEVYEKPLPKYVVYDTVTKKKVSDPSEDKIDAANLAYKMNKENK